MTSEQDGLQEQKEILIRKLNYFYKELAITSDAEQKFSLQMRIEESEKKLEEVKAKIAQNVTQEDSVLIEPLVKTPIIQNDSKTRYDKFVDKLKNNRFWVIIIIAFVVIGGIGTLVELIKNTQEILPPKQDKPKIITSKDSTITNLIDLSKEALDISDATLMRNQEVFLQVFQDSVNIKNLEELLQYQKFRSKFGKIIKQLSSIEDKISQDTSLLMLVSELNNILIDIKNLYYSEGYASYHANKIFFYKLSETLKQREIEKADDVRLIGSKYGVIRFIQSYWGRDQEYNNICKTIVEVYLRELRDNNERIGEIHGYFLSLKD